MTSSFESIARASTPAELHEAYLRFELGKVWGLPWLVYLLSPGLTLRELWVRLDLPYHLSWPTTLRGGARMMVKSRADHQDMGFLYISALKEPMSTELAWRLAIASGAKVLTYPHGIDAPGLFIPPDASPSGTVPSGPEGISDAYGGIVAMKYYLDQFQRLALAASNPVQVPGFPKLSTGPAQPTFKGKRLF